MTDLMSKPVAATLGQAARPPRRTDIQGLRTVAVGLVILNHLFDWPSGGFIGVDVFFVISGFLITEVLLRQREKAHGGRGILTVIVNFYRKRVKRIMPAALTTLVVTVILGELLFTETRAHDTLVAATWALFFGANIHFADLGTDYFGRTAAISPVQHFWSLSVEEQFYFVWPLLMLLVFFVLAKLGRHGAGRATAAAVMAVLVVASFAFALHLTSTDATTAYFSTLARAWELGLGALLAITAPVFVRMPARLRTATGWLGLLVIVVGAFTVSAANGFPAPAAAVPVIGSALVLLAGIGGPQHRLWPLTNPVSEYLGDISYSLYLWHFPIIIYMGVVLPEGTTLYYCSTFVLIFLVSILSFHALEDPLRQSEWHVLRRGLNRTRPYEAEIPRVYLWVLALFTVTFVLVSVALKPLPSVPENKLTVADQKLLTNSDADQEQTPQTKVARQVLQALEATSWPNDLNPSTDAAADDKAPEFDDGCMYPDLSDPTVCTYGTGARMAVIVGDSISVSWMPGIREALGSGWTIRDIGYGSCAFLDSPRELGDPTADRLCNDDRDDVVRLISQLDPDLVIMTNNQGGLASLPGDETGAALVAQWTKARVGAIESIEAKGRDIVMLTPPPMGASIDECAGAMSSPEDCVTGIGIEWKEMLEGDLAAARQTGARVIDAQSWFCSDSERCPIFVDTAPVRTDELHLTATYSRQLAPVLRWALFDQEGIGRK